MKDPHSNTRHLITVDELRAAGALDVPPAWRKSLGVQRELLLFGEDDMLPNKPQPTPDDAEDTESADDNGSAEERE